MEGEFPSGNIFTIPSLSFFYRNRAGFVIVSTGDCSFKLERLEMLDKSLQNNNKVIITKWTYVISRSIVLRKTYCKLNQSMSVLIFHVYNFLITIMVLSSLTGTHILVLDKCCICIRNQIWSMYTKPFSIYKMYNIMILVLYWHGWYCFNFVFNWSQTKSFHVWPTPWMKRKWFMVGK